MSRVTLFFAVISGITAAACSIGMTDLSDKRDDGRANEVATNGGEQPTASGESTVLEPASDAPPVDEEDAAMPDVKLDVGDDAGAPMQTGCQLVTFLPTTAANGPGGDRAWNGTTNALVDDGTPATVTLSTDRRESAPLVFSGFKGPAIPANAVIKGLMVDIDRNSGGSCIQARAISARVGGVDRARADVNDPWQGVRFYGGIDDTWGTTIAPADLGSLSVGVTARLVGTQASCPQRDARVDTVRVRVHYCVN